MSVIAFLLACVLALAFLLCLPIVIPLAIVAVISLAVAVISIPLAVFGFVIEHPFATIVLGVAAFVVLSHSG